MNRTITGVILVLLSAFGYGLLPIFAVLSYKGGINVFTLLLFRFSIASLFLFSYILIKREPIKLEKKNLLALFVLGGVFYTLQSICYFSAVKFIPVSLAALILYTYPIVVALLSLLIDKEKLNLKSFIAIAVCFSGLALVLGTTTVSVNITGILFAAGASIVYSCYIVLGNRVVKQLSPIVISAFISLFTAFSMLTAGLVSNSINLNFTTETWIYVLGIVLFATILAILTFFGGLERLGPVKASVLSMMEPVFSIIFSIAVFGEKITALGYIGGFLVLIGAIIIVVSKQPARN